MNLQCSILNISLFGSYGRGNSDPNSDLDIIVLCPDNGGTQPEDYVRKVVATEFKLEPSISWYGERKLKHFFDTGDLFAWHLFLESRPMAGYEHIKQIFGEPRPYRNCRDDVEGLVEILEGVPAQIAARPQNLTYELGVLYVCLRNIAMSASSVLCDQVIFGRHSPFLLPDASLPISRAEFDILASCRHASTRGINEPKIDFSIDYVLEKSITWAHSIKRRIK